MKIERILYPTDFSTKTENAREHAIYMAQSLNSSLYLLHAIEPLDYEEMDEEIIDFYKGLENQLEVKMEAEIKILQDAGLKTQAEIIIGSRWKVINNYAKENDIDLIIMGSHGVRSESGELSVGTTSHKVMFSSPCPVLIVRHEAD
ncbi:MAG: universal stress protein [Thermodesulfobacteriota bacterium]|nr:MAG: universal stress protein [Thermodesulfobacteriota bacterium]